MSKVFLIIIIPIIANLILLDLFAAQAFLIKEPNKVARNKPAIPTPVISPAKDATTSAASTKPVIPSAAVSMPPAVSSQIPDVREYFIPFGSGNSSAGDWADVPGLSAYIDSTLYTKKQDVLFEASVHIPTGNQSAYVRLFNVTDQHPVWFSDVSTDGSGGNLLISNPITLDKGKKQYQVQMKTSLQYPAILDQARLHIVVY